MYRSLSIVILSSILLQYGATSAAVDLQNNRVGTTQSDPITQTTKTAKTVTDSKVLPGASKNAETGTGSLSEYLARYHQEASSVQYSPSAATLPQPVAYPDRGVFEKVLQERYPGFYIAGGRLGGRKNKAVADRKSLVSGYFGGGKQMAFAAVLVRELKQQKKEGLGVTQGYPVKSLAVKSLAEPEVLETSDVIETEDGDRHDPEIVDAMIVVCHPREAPGVFACETLSGWRTSANEETSLSVAPVGQYSCLVDSGSANITTTAPALKIKTEVDETVWVPLWLPLDIAPYMHCVVKRSPATH